MNSGLSQIANEEEAVPVSGIRAAIPCLDPWDLTERQHLSYDYDSEGGAAVASAYAIGDTPAIAELFDRHAATVTRFVCRHVQSRADVEDIVQATFVKVVRGISSFDGRSMVSTWLLGIAANVIKHHQRSRARRQRFESLLALGQGEGRETRVTERIEARRSLAAANDALQRLDLEKRQAFVMCELEGLSAREAAMTLGATETTVWKRVSDTRKILRRAMPTELVLKMETKESGSSIDS